MAEPRRQARRSAWLFAHKLITLAKVVGEFAGTDLIHVTTAELCKGLGRPDGAVLEQVQQFAREVAELMRGYGLDTACGCGYLALTGGEEGCRERALEQDREPTVYTPDDLDAALDAYLLGLRAPASAGGQPSACQRS
jgi:hypothetical protein